MNEPTINQHSRYADNDLKAHVLYGFTWTAIINVVVRALAFALNLILAKLLAPDIFGVIALANIAIRAMELLNNFGMGAALIRHHSSDPRVAKTAFTLRTLQGTFLFLLSIIFSGTLADYFHSPILQYVIPALGINFVLSASWAIPMNLMEKQLEFKKQFIPQAIPALLQFITAVWMASAGYGVWSIVVGQIVWNIAQILFYSRMLPYRLGFVFDTKIIRELMSFGVPVFFMGFIWYLVYYLPNWIIGKLYGETELGYFSFAFTLISVPITELIYNIVNRVLFPTYSKLAGDTERLASSYIKSIRYLAIVSIPLSVAIPVFAGDLLHALYGNKWDAAILPLQAMGIYAFMRSFAALTGSIFYALGKTKELLINAIVCLVIFSALIYPAALKYGNSGVAAALSAAWTISLYILMIRLKGLIGVSISTFLRTIFRPLILSIIVILSYKYAGSALFDLTIIWILCPLFLVIAVFYIGLIAWLDKDVLRSIRVLLKEKRLTIV